MNRTKRISDIFMIVSLMLATLVLASLFTTLWAQQRNPIVRPPELDTKAKISSFIDSVLTDKTRRPDPFVANEQMGVDQVAKYEVEAKPRPDYGFGKYDVENLILQGIWREDEQVYAIFRTPDQKSMIVSVGDEAYDGRIVEINLQGRYVKFLQELRRKTQDDSGQPSQPDVIFTEKIVRFRK